MVGAVKGYKVVVVMPETMSVERRKLIQAYGRSWFTPKEEDVQARLGKEIAEKPLMPDTDQFSNPVNPAFTNNNRQEILSRPAVPSMPWL